MSLCGLPGCSNAAYLDKQTCRFHVGMGRFIAPPNVGNGMEPLTQTQVDLIKGPARRVKPECEAQPSPTAFKADDGKPRFDLLMDGMPHAILDVVRVLSWAVAAKRDATWADGGGKGYRPHSWKEVPEAKRRYRAAMQRHENAIARGEVNDTESGLPHRAHIATNAMFLAELDHIKEVV